MTTLNNDQWQEAIVQLANTGITLDAASVNIGGVEVLDSGGTNKLAVDASGRLTLVPNQVVEIGDGTTPTQKLAIDSSGRITLLGSKTNNNAAPDGTNVPVLPALANAAAPTWTEGYSVRESMDLSGNQRTTLGTLIAGENLTTNRLNNEPVYSYNNITSKTTTTVKSGAGTLARITINKPGSADTLTIYDNTAASGTLIGTITVTAGYPYVYDASFSTGLTIVSGGTTAGDYTVLYR